VATNLVVELVDVVKDYPGPVQVLREVTLAIERGELTAIVGPSGSGKSTLLHILGTLERPSSGIVRVAGHDASSAPDATVAALRAREIGFVFQQFFLLDGMSAIDNVANGMLYAGVPAAERRSAAIEALERVGLGHRLDHDPARLSGGERQRVAIARALLGRPSLVLADEPTGDLDSTSGQEIVRLLQELHRSGATILVITHDPEVAAAMPRQIELRDGRVVRDSVSGLR
jgi:putative ABC transport system ATP-binding protein